MTLTDTCPDCGHTGPVETSKWGGKGAHGCALICKNCGSRIEVMNRVQMEYKLTPFGPVLDGTMSTFQYRGDMDPDPDDMGMCEVCNQVKAVGTLDGVAICSGCEVVVCEHDDTHVVDDHGGIDTFCLDCGVSV